MILHFIIIKILHRTQYFTAGRHLQHRTYNLSSIGVRKEQVQEYSLLKNNNLVLRVRKRDHTLHQYY